MTELDALAAPPYKDRSTGLVIFGVLTICLGCLSGLFVPLMIVGQAAAAKLQSRSIDSTMMLPAVALYGGVAVALILLGIGSIGKRRWARALLLIFSWSWLATGVFALLAVSFVLPRVFANQPTMSPGATRVAIVITVLLLGIFFVLIPAIGVFFYGHRDVKATCEVRDPVTRWTDVCPLPVLGLALWLAISVPMFMVMPLFGYDAAPFFGTFLTGVPAALYYFVVAAIWGTAAVQIYRLERRGWWLILAAWAAYLASSLVTFSRHSMLEFYRLTGRPQDQIDRIQATGLTTGHWMLWVVALLAVPTFAYLVFVKKYFPRAGTLA